MALGKIIYLNGVSSSGKTTLYKAIRDAGSDYWHWLAIDTFMSMTDAKIWQRSGVEAVTFAMEMLHRTAALYSTHGHNVVVDQVMLRDYHYPYFEQFINILYGYPVFMVHVTCPLKELERREKERGDRQIGLAATQLYLLRPKDIYDLTVDTHVHSSEECAHAILTLSGKMNEWWAFRELCRRHSQGVEIP